MVDNEAGNIQFFRMLRLFLLAGLIVSLSAATSRAAPHAVIIHGERYYGSEQTMPDLAATLEKEHGFTTTVLTSPEGSMALPDLTVLDEADLLVLYIRFREANGEQLARLHKWFEDGKPVVAFRTSSHGIAEKKGWFVPYFGGHFKAHAGGDAGLTAVVAPGAGGHPVLDGVGPVLRLKHGGLYNAQPLSDHARPLLLGKTSDLPGEPVAWTAEYKPGQRLFYTSLGTKEDFEEPGFQKLVRNACRWCSGLTESENAGEKVAHSYPAPSVKSPPVGSTVLLGPETFAFAHYDPSVPPRSIAIDKTADTTSGGPVFKKARWESKDGVAVARPGFGDIVSDRPVGDATVHVEFLIPADASGESTPAAFRGNSGVYIDGKYEIQIVDSFGKKKTDDRYTCGALFGVAAPLKNACKAPGEWQELDVSVRHLEVGVEISAWLNGELIHDRVRVVEPTVYGFKEPRSQPPSKKGAVVFNRKQSAKLDLNKDFTIITRFRTEVGGPLFSKISRDGEHEKNDKVLYVGDDALFYDIGWVGTIEVDRDVSDGDWHTVAVRGKKGEVDVFVDGEHEESREEFAAPDSADRVIKLGRSPPDFPNGEAGAPSVFDGVIGDCRMFAEALSDEDIELATASEPVERVKPVLKWGNPNAPPTDNEVGGPLRLQADTSAVRFANIWTSPLGNVDHAGLINAWNDEGFARGKRIYDGLCIVCHGNLEKKGTLPTSRPFWKDPFKNGSDPHSLYLTMKNGFEQMPPQPWLTASQAYDVIHYIREELVKPNNASQYFKVTDEYLAGLPKGVAGEEPLTKEQIDFAKGPKYLRMDFGPMLDWTYEVAPDNIAYKGIAIRLDEGAGGVSRGRAWMVYDHDTMRVAAAYSGNGFVDWKCIAFDQSHGTHPSIVGEKAFVNPVGPGWAHPETGAWEDPRFRGRDDKPYGPLPRDWAHFKGQYLHGNKIVLKYTVGDAEILEMPVLESVSPSVVYSRVLNIGKSSNDLKLRLAPEETGTALAGSLEGQPVSIDLVGGFRVLHVPAEKTPLNIKVLCGAIDPGAVQIAAFAAEPAEDLSRYTKGGPARWTETVETEGRQGEGGDDPFVVDEIICPHDNPYGSWMRIGGFDFLPDGKRAVVATWLGDVWIVDGIDGELGKHRWKRICTGLFQPLGVKVRNGEIYITCRDQLARLHDFNGDEEIDFVESFNNDHQVTEHFHEFAMGLQTDEEGNFYYAKSARHAKTALVAHHGTLLKVSADGETTEILANGFRAANGVCLNPDGTFIVTDQEGHWNPKNRINYVKRGGFYGNMFGYHDVTDSSDEAMEQPLCWITNAFDRSPGELMWVPENAAWGPLNGHLLNLSYGMGRVFVVPHEKIRGQAQGGMCSVGLDFPTGIMRGRFHSDNGQLYATGMFAWAGNKHKDGSFYRIRYTEKPALLPVKLQALPGRMRVILSDPVDRQAATELGRYAVKIWRLKRTRNYGSKHYNERSLDIESVTVSEDGQSMDLHIPQLAPTWCMEIRMGLKGVDGNEVERVIHNTVHQLGSLK